jgi:hypothetical protein
LKIGCDNLTQSQLTKNFNLRQFIKQNIIVRPRENHVKTASDSEHVILGKSNGKQVSFFIVFTTVKIKKELSKRHFGQKIDRRLFFCKIFYK